MALGEAEIAALHLAAIVQSSDDAIVSKSLDSTILSWNGAAERMFGYTAAEAIGRSIRMIIPAERQGEEDHVLARIRAGKIVDHFETVRVRKDGTRLDISLTTSPIRDANGVIIGASKIARDITEQKRIAAALAQAEADRRDLQQRLLALTSASASLLGSPKLEHVLPATLSLASDLITADGYAVWRLDVAQQAWSIVSHVGVSAEFAALRVQPEGNGVFTEPIVVEDVTTLVAPPARYEAYEKEGLRSMLAVPLILASQGFASLVFYFRQPHRFSEVEVTTARALGNLAAAALTTAGLYDEQRRREVQARFLAEVGDAFMRSLDYRQTLRAAAQSAVPTIADWCAIDMARADGTLERLAMVHTDSAKVAMAEGFRERYPTDPQSPYSAEHVIRTGTPLLVEYLSDEMVVAGARDPQHLEAMRALGITSFMCVPLRTRSGSVGAITFVAAESGRRYRQGDLHFAEAVAGRAALAIENAMAYDEATRANRLKDEFLATLSHELRTPLNAILGYTRMVRTESVAKDRREKALETVERNALSLALIVDDVLDMSRVVSGKLAMQVQPVRLSRLMDESVATVLPAAQAKGVEIRMRVAPEVGTIAADPDRLRQVLWNLLSNAVKFTSRGGHVDVEARRAGDDIEIIVIDTGEGISPEFLPHVFERFRQADNRMAGVRTGLGLGLAIVRHIVEAHGGTIAASSEGLGKGSTFRISLPATESAATD